MYACKICAKFHLYNARNAYLVVKREIFGVKCKHCKHCCRVPVIDSCGGGGSRGRGEEKSQVSGCRRPLYLRATGLGNFWRIGHRSHSLCGIYRERVSRENGRSSFLLIFTSANFHRNSTRPRSFSHWNIPSIKGLRTVLFISSHLGAVLCLPFLIEGSKKGIIFSSDQNWTIVHNEK